MDTQYKKPLTLAATLIALGSLAGSAGTTVTITRFDVTTNSITVAITGDLLGLSPGSMDPNRLYIGVPGDNDWVINQGTAFVGSIQASNAGASNSHLAGSYGNGGDFIRIGWATPLTQTDTFSGQFTITAANGAFVPAIRYRTSPAASTNPRSISRQLPPRASLRKRTISSCARPHRRGL